MARKDSGRGPRPRQTREQIPAEAAPREESTRRRTRRMAPRTEAVEAAGDTPASEPPRRQRTAGAAALETPTERGGSEQEPAPQQSEAPRARRRERQRAPHGNALGILIERHFTDPASPCRSYSDLERRSGISREALSRYVTARRDRRRSPTIDTLAAIAGAMHLSLESICRAAAASIHGVIPPPEEEQRAREEMLGTLVAGLSNEQFGAVVELLRHFQPAPLAAG